MSTFNTTMFQSIKDALSKNDTESSTASYTEILKTTPGNTYTVRLLPFSKDPKNTFFHYYNHGWVSFSTGQYVQSLSPQTFGERDPIAEERFRILRTGTEDEKEKVKSIKRLEKYLVNVYVVDDSSNPDNNGQVKILRYGKQLHKIIMEAIEGEDADEFGPRIFDLGPTGVNFKIKCENQGEYPTYVSSRFTTSSKLNIDEDKQKHIYDSVFDLTKVYTLKSYDELKQMLDEHYYCATDAPTNTSSNIEVTPIREVNNSNNSNISDTNIEDEIDELLKGL